MKFKFISICSQSDLAMAVNLPVDEDYELYIKPRCLLIKRLKSEGPPQIEVIALKRLVRWQINKEYL